MVQPGLHPHHPLSLGLGGPPGSSLEALRAHAQAAMQSPIPLQASHGKFIVLRFYNEFKDTSINCLFYSIEENKVDHCKVCNIEIDNGITRVYVHNNKILLFYFLNNCIYF